TRGLSIIIDYAVTPDSLEKLYALIARMRLEGQKIIAILGACGERDRGKRPIMGAIVSAQADIVILTNEDPYHEDPERIIDEIEQGITGKEKEKDWFRIFDRRAAIARALSLAEPGDIVVITGKGAEETMAQGDERLPWSERTVILEELGKMQ
ncbi:MAG: UDP-N-acetylmuramoyl-L-alanyl-D-glutamate--2,6-diaminopimelate ligase, partial [Candidatus Moranbacteria bacterium]|nr:UDP-N-acetylmuramoyl-L-alanyl-D-glutamate--2,6-diaminopimelate ligase [Candidatus Moranbacteria bacterium]